MYYLLKGKRTISMLYGGLEAKCLNLLQLYPTISMDKFQVQVKKMISELLLEETEVGLIRTSLGQQRYEAQQNNFYHLAVYDGGRYPDLTAFIAKLILATQVVTEFGHQNNHYFPYKTSTQIQIQVKQWFSRVKSDQLPQQFKVEWVKILSSLPQDSSDLIAQLLMGNGQLPQTIQQLATLFQQSVLECYLREMDAFTLLVRLISEQPTNFPLFFSLWSANRPVQLVSDSILSSYQLFLDGKSTRDIANIRHLKESTVNEHLLEAAIFLTDFPFKGCWDKTEYTRLNELLPKPWTTEFKLINEQLPQITFFKYRLFQIMRCKAIGI